MAERPSLCPDSTCKCIFTDFDPAYFEKGYSFNCVGELAEPHEFKWREITHRNTHCHCIYSPLKGVIKFLITPEDAWGTKVMMANLMKVARPVQCDECGETDRIGESYLKHGGKSYCKRCALRLGIFRWDGHGYYYTGRKSHRPIITAEELKIIVMCYWRFSRGCPIVAMEFSYGESDVISVTRNAMAIETEVKTSVRDLKRDRQKPKHLTMERDMDFTRGKPAEFPYIRAVRVHYFYFAVPAQIKEKALPAVEELYPYAGLLAVQPADNYSWDRWVSPAVSAVRKAHRFNKPKLTPEQVMDIARGMSTTTCRLGYELLRKGR